MSQVITFKENSSDYFIGPEKKVGKNLSNLYSQDIIISWIKNNVEINEFKKGIILSNKDEPFNHYSFQNNSDAKFNVDIIMSIDNVRNDVLKAISIVKKDNQEISKKEWNKAKRWVIENFPNAHFPTLDNENQTYLINLYCDNKTNPEDLESKFSMYLDNNLTQDSFHR